MHDLIIDDEKCASQKEQFLKFAGDIERLIQDYIGHLDQITTEAIKSGEAHDSLIAFKELAAQLSGSYSYLGSAISFAFENFKADSDKADKYLYDA